MAILTLPASVTRMSVIKPTPRSYATLPAQSRARVGIFRGLTRARTGCATVGSGVQIGGCGDTVQFCRT